MKIKNQGYYFDVNMYVKIHSRVLHSFMGGLSGIEACFTKTKQLM